MKKILCDSMLCKNNTSERPLTAGECMCDEIQLGYCNNVSEVLECKNYKVSETKLEIVKKYWDEHEDEGM